jgi:HSP20 family protein
MTVAPKNKNKERMTSRGHITRMNPKTSKSGQEISPAVNVDDKMQEYIVYVAVPGMQRKDFSVKINNRLLTVAAAKTEALHCYSCDDQQTFPVWNETFKLPEDADTVMTAAVYRNGELEIHIPKGKKNTAVPPAEVFVY